ncbi:MAG: hypothetical protein L6R42_000907 [Xanthoria sp. 1 TBL-2021]|nr:MAG: hypothetical protein L6R42_000907 [Xanthoria sp. 1 TBL-2021]
MKLTSAFAIAAVCQAAALALPVDNLEKRETVKGFDISHYQATVNYQGAYNSGARFVIIKATEGTTYIDPKFSQHYNGATAAGLIRGGYHFARPGSSSGAAQATYFVAHGGGWSGDGRTLPGMLDMEYGTASQGGTCHGLSKTSMVNWITDFVNTYHGKTSRWPMIYTTNDWWVTCTGNSNAFNTKSPLVLARYSTAGPGTIPGGWPFQTIWQNSDSYTYGGDSDIFNGALTNLKKLATG